MRTLGVAVFLFLATLSGFALWAIASKAGSEAKPEAVSYSRALAVGMFIGAGLGLVFLIQELLR